MRLELVMKVDAKHKQCFIATLIKHKEINSEEESVAVVKRKLNKTNRVTRRLR